ncbi:MAG TPA: serine protease, partial [Phototrophicaceae bacterium]|nr:serine protease [Phototrophicaceae bacterium]
MKRSGLLIVVVMVLLLTVTASGVTASDRHRLPAALSAVSAPYFTIPAQSGGLTNDAINTIASSVVYIETEERGHPFASGSGTLITSTGLIFTNRHVIEDGDDFHIFLLEDMRELPVPRYYASLVHVFDEIDFAVLQIDRDDDKDDIDPSKLDLPFLEATTEEVGYGDPIYIFGYPDIGDGYLVLTQGSITTIENGELVDQKLPVWYRTDAEMSSGNSGGLVVNDKGEYVGIPTWVRKADSTLGQLGGILPYPAIKTVLDANGGLDGPPTVDDNGNNDNGNDGGSSTVVVQNDSRDDICYLYLSPSTSTEWGGNFLDDQLAAGDSVELNIDPGTYDIQLKDCDDKELDDERDLVIEDSLDITYSRSGIEFDAPEVAPVEQSLTIEIQKVEYDAELEDENELGIKVYAYIRATGYKGVDLRVAMFYYWENGDPMSGENAIDDNNTPDGDLTVQTVLTPEYDDTEWDGFWFWMPYSAFPDFRGSEKD